MDVWLNETLVPSFHHFVVSDTRFSGHLLFLFTETIRKFFLTMYAVMSRGILYLYVMMEIQPYEIIKLKALEIGHYKG